MSVDWKCPKAINVHEFPFTRWANFLWALRHPILWLEYRRRICRGLPEQAALTGWKVVDCRNAPGHLSDVVYDPVGYDPSAGKTFELGKRLNEKETK